MFVPLATFRGMSDFDPYAPPQADLTRPADPNETRLARRLTRFAASFLDGLIMIVPALLLIWGLYAVFGRRFWQPQADVTGFLLGFGATILGALVYLAINGRLLARHGQTVGKRMCDIRILKMDGSLPTLGESYGKRFLLIQLLQAVPLVGPFLSLLDILLIFRKSRRCLHDQIAGTIVIQI